MFALQVASEEKPGGQERRWESGEHDRKQQQQHIPAPTQWHNQVQGFGLSYVFSVPCLRIHYPSDCIVAHSLLQDEGGEMMGGGSNGATGIGNSGLRLQSSQCGSERQVHICSVSAPMVIFAHYHLALGPYYLSLI